MVAKIVDFQYYVAHSRDATQNEDPELRQERLAQAANGFRALPIVR